MEFINGKWVNTNQGTANVVPDGGGGTIDVSTMSNTDFNSFAENNPVALQALGKNGYTASTANMAGLGVDGLAIAEQPSWLDKNKEALGFAADIGQFGLGVLQYGQTKKANEKRGQLIDDQLLSNKLARKEHANLTSNFRNFKKAPVAGLGV